MILDLQEQVELSRLLVRAREGDPLRPAEQGRMRALVAKGNPAAAGQPLDDLVSAGLIVLGAIWFLGWGEASTAST
ncbi:MAG: hypothetical protein LC623_07675 [Halobacteriales archaeon]|nr:hypothetical protein [Halobacteriales archaeon]